MTALCEDAGSSRDGEAIRTGRRQFGFAFTDPGSVAEPPTVQATAG
ncbi:hypothetical protein MMMB2_4237 [Mycobacterium marinum MB2]|nr:hypothetical protein MMSP_4831 [Mycobacterium sp. 012931]EPQ70396.1 hypothetical protein MMEU_4835 [Mycobacterium marinum str. Europe]EPQ73465.1 hypothetical protein MMMB2_4237 [Mycobacterium marinum MB2]